MLTEQDKAIGRTVLRELERVSGHRLSVLEVQIRQLQRKVESLERELESQKRYSHQLEQAVVQLAAKRS